MQSSIMKSIPSNAPNMEPLATFSPPALAFAKIPLSNPSAYLHEAAAEEDDEWMIVITSSHHQQVITITDMLRT